MATGESLIGMSSLIGFFSPLSFVSDFRFPTFDFVSLEGGKLSPVDGLRATVFDVQNIESCLNYRLISCGAGLYSIHDGVASDSR